MSAKVVKVVIGSNPPGRLDKALAQFAPEQEVLSRSRIASLIASGDVSLDGEVVETPRAKVAEGQVWEISIAPAAEWGVVAEDIPLEIVYEDDDLLVVNKPAGMVVHPAPGSPSGTLVNALLAHCGDDLAGIGGEKRPGIVHRIDKDTSGLLVVAKNDAAHQGLAAQFEAHHVERFYCAFCYGCPDVSDPRLLGLRGVSVEPGQVIKVTSGLARHPNDRQRQAVTFRGGKHAVTRLRVVSSFGTPPAAAEVQCWLETGRTHQIRVHMAHIGHGLIGDPVYGGKRRLSERALGETATKAASSFPRQALHAAVLGFVHPKTGEKLRFEAPLPNDLKELRAALQG